MIAVALALAAMPSAAQATWREASSAHFVIYAEDAEQDMLEFTQELERFHSALELVTGHKLGAVSPSNRVTIYVVPNQRQVGSLYNSLGGDGRFIGGFYMPRAGSSVAIVQRIHDGVGSELDESMIILLHEYTHHFVASAASFPIPRWMSEGGAEFFGTASFGKDGSVGIGLAANHRGTELFELSQVPIEELFDDELYSKNRHGYDSYYGWSWLLYHYMTFAPERRGQLSKYITLLQQGRLSIDAAHEAFGDFDQLRRDLNKYLRSRKLTFLNLTPELLATGQVTVRTLSEGAGEMMSVRIRSKVGVTAETAPGVVADARKVAARYHSDPFVLAALAEAEHDAGHQEEAIAAADAALADDPKEVNAYVQKGLALFAEARKADDPDAAYAKAIKPFVALNKIENDHPLPLVYYFRSYTDRGKVPPDLAVQGLRRAVELAPFDTGLRMTLAFQQLHHGDVALARRNLEPVAFDPHAEGAGKTAQAILERLDAPGPAPTDDEITALIERVDAAEAAPAGGAGKE